MASPINTPQDIRIIKSKVTLDFTTVFGIVLTFALIATAIAIGKSDANFFNIPSFLIVVLGTMSVTAISFSGEELLNAGKVIGNSLFRTRLSAKDYANQLMDIAVLAKNKGLLTLGAIESN